MNTVDLAGIVLRATLILVGALALATLLRRHAGSTRHALWTVTTLLLLALPLLQGRFAVLPSEWSWLTNPREMESAVIVPAHAGATGDASLIEAATQVNDALVPLTGAVSSSPGRNAAHLLGGAWLLGLMGFLAPVLLGVVRARRLIRDAVPVDDARLLARFAAVRREVGVRREVHLAMAPNIRTPMTGGIVASVVLLPADAATWSDECVTTVFRHELVHVRRADAIRQLASRLSVALYWFHPLAWRAARHASLAREQACDEAVLRLGARPSQYARHLLHFADAGG